MKADASPKRASRRTANSFISVVCVGGCMGLDGLVRKGETTGSDMVLTIFQCCGRVNQCQPIDWPPSNQQSIESTAHQIVDNVY